MRPRRVVLFMLAALAMLAASSDSARFEKLGHRLVCICGCNQVLLECNHVGCPSSEGMRQHLQAGLDAGKTDPQVMETFVVKYGALVLAAPTMRGFDRVAWIMPFAVLLVGALLAIAVVRLWRGRGAAPLAASAAASNTELKARVRRETQE